MENTTNLLQQKGSPPRSDSFNDGAAPLFRKKSTSLSSNPKIHRRSTLPSSLDSRSVHSPSLRKESGEEENSSEEDEAIVSSRPPKNRPNQPRKLAKSLPVKAAASRRLSASEKSGERKGETGTSNLKRATSAPTKRSASTGAPLPRKTSKRLTATFSKSGSLKVKVSNWVVASTAMSPFVKGESYQLRVNLEPPGYADSTIEFVRSLGSQNSTVAKISYSELKQVHWGVVPEGSTATGIVIEFWLKTLKAKETVSAFVKGWWQVEEVPVDEGLTLLVHVEQDDITINWVPKSESPLSDLLRSLETYSKEGGHGKFEQVNKEQSLNYRHQILVADIYASSRWTRKVVEEERRKEEQGRSE